MFWRLWIEIVKVIWVCCLCFFLLIVFNVFLLIKVCILLKKVLNFIGLFLFNLWRFIKFLELLVWRRIFNLVFFFFEILLIICELFLVRKWYIFCIIIGFVLIRFLNFDWNFLCIILVWYIGICLFMFDMICFEVLKFVYGGVC